MGMIHIISMPHLSALLVATTVNVCHVSWEMDSIFQASVQQCMSLIFQTSIKQTNTLEINTSKYHFSFVDCAYSDINECADSSQNSCSSSATCTDTIVSYYCTCDSGFTGDGISCECNRVI